MATAVQTPMYYGIKLSENIARTPQGYLLCQNAVIGRTGYQTYKGRELRKQDLDKIGVHVQPEDDVEIYRSHEEVFSPETIASFEGMPVTDGHPPGSEFVDSDNIHELQRGHLQNVRKGAEALKSGDWPLVADILITHASLIAKVEAGERELSGAYEYELKFENGKILQCKILGNHAAVVPQGRAGAEARIVDEAPMQEVIKFTKEKPVAITLKKIIGLGLKAFATDASPEELQEAADAASLTGTHTETSAGGKTTDEEEEKEEKKAEKSDDKKRGKDRKKADDRKADDAKGKDRKAMHKLLDEFLNKQEKEEEEPEAEDAKHSAECDDEDCDGSCMDKAKDESEEEREEELEGKDKGRAHDAILEPLGDYEEKRVPSRDSESRLVLKIMRKAVAASKDNDVRRAFDAACEAVSKNRGNGNGSYADFVEAADSVDKAKVTDARADLGLDMSQEAIKKQNEGFAARHKKARADGKV